MILATILIYFCILLIFSKITSHKANNETFYRGNRRSPWYMVAFGMVGASISGITFVSVPGMAYKMNMTYLQMRRDPDRQGHHQGQLCRGQHPDGGL